MAADCPSNSSTEKMRNFEWELSASDLRAGANLIVLIGPETVTPKAMGHGDDTREMSLRVRRVAKLVGPGDDASAAPPSSHRPRKRFGQHFLAQSWANKVVAAIEPRPGDVFLEIGPGSGALTFPLAATGAPILAIGIDRDLVGGARRTCADERHDSFGRHTSRRMWSRF